MGKTATQTVWVLWDWKKKSVRARKTKPGSSDVGTNVFVTEVNLKANIPDSKLIHEEMEMEFDVPSPMLESAVAEALDTRAFLDWEKDAESVIAERIDEIEDADDDEVDSLTDSITIAVLRQAKGRPSINEVEKYVASSIRDIRSR